MREGYGDAVFIPENGSFTTLLIPNQDYEASEIFFSFFFFIIFGTSRGSFIVWVRLL